MARILIVDDDITFATMVQSLLAKRGFDTMKTSRVGAAIKLIGGGEDFNLVLSDLRLPDRDGLFLLQWMRKSGQSTPFIMMTSYAEIQNAVQTMKLGATDYIAKPFHPDVLLQKIADALKTQEKEERREKSAKASTKTSSTKYIEGTSEASKQLYQYVGLVAPTPMSVLILGASGTGKEYVARRIHEQSDRCGKPFFALDCGAIPHDVAASEFFGYKKGAFTGADTDKTGAFEAANGGTLFLDEVGNLSYDIQVQLLRALQERCIRPLGSNSETAIDIRLVCATNENLSQAVADGRFREDLFHRINEFTIYMPALKDRGTDLFRFADLFLQQANEELSRQVEGFDSTASEMLARYDWPGNLRELNNVVKRAVLLSPGRQITADTLRQSMQPTAKSENFTLHNADDECQRIVKALEATKNNKSKAAQLLGIDRKTLYNKLKLYSLS